MTKDKRPAEGGLYGDAPVIKRAGYTTYRYVTCFFCFFYGHLFISLDLRIILRCLEASTLSTRDRSTERLEAIQGVR